MPNGPAANAPRAPFRPWEHQTGTSGQAQPPNYARPVPPPVGTADIETVFQRDLTAIYQAFVDGKIDKPTFKGAIKGYLDEAVALHPFNAPPAVFTYWYGRADSHEQQLADAAARGTAGNGPQVPPQQPGGGHNGPQVPPQPRAPTPQRPESNDGRGRPDERSARRNDSGSRSRSRGRRRDRGRRHRSASSSLSSNASERRPRKRRGYAWEADDILHQATLSPAHLDVAEQVASFEDDMSKALSRLHGSYGKPEFPEAQWKKVLRDGAINLDEVFTYSTSTDLKDGYTEAELGGGSNVFFRLEREKSIKPITRRDQWEDAFDDTCTAINYAYTGRSSELATYKRHITDLFRYRVVTDHGQILKYDKACRNTIASSRRILYNDLHEFARHKANFLDVGGKDYVASAGKSSQGKTHQGGGGGGQGARKSKQICRNFNKKVCSNGAACSRRHVCKRCESEGHAEPDCKST